MDDDRSEVVIACSLRPGDLDDRREVWERLAMRALRESRPTDDGVRFSFTASEETERDLRELARLEAECCAFAEWRLTRRGEELVLDVTSDGGGAAAIRALFGFGPPIVERGQLALTPASHSSAPPAGRGTAFQSLRAQISERRSWN